MEINYHTYPQPRIRHHTNPQFYLPYSQLTVKPRVYPPLVEQIEWSELFGNGNPPTVLDIGCGMGNFLLNYAEAMPHANILGIENRRQATEWINRVATGEGLTNIHALWYSVVNGLHFIQSASIQRVFYFFPDPWFKKRHAKRRAFTSEFVDELARITKPDATLYLMTDVPEVDEYQCAILREHGAFTVSDVIDDAAWLPARTDQELICERNDVPYVKRICRKSG
ncbi:MAG: tRNA (guanosine(46)-N7)-methyltransferase TrmB [Candidatus Kapabacteria bacterium]|nr:tRNA (guanosine(46)-N7)-methyltransferase TrmB [Candidatus Kapabacteria bacterium]